MTRVQIAATLLASFTFFGGVQATNARNAEARLGEDISSIERTYDGAFAAADEAVASAAATELLSDPAWTPAFEQLTEALVDQQSADQEIAAARAAIAREPNSQLRDFRIQADEVRPAVENARFLERVRPAARISHETWTHAEGERLAADAEALRREVTTELVNAAADVGREAIAKRLVAEFFTGSVAEGFAAVVLDASVLYDFRHVVADATASLIERVLRRRNNVRTAFAAVMPRLRSDAARLAIPGARTAESVYAERARVSREQLDINQRVRQNTLEEFRVAADTQAARERSGLIEQVTKKLDGDLELATRSLLDRLIGGAERPAMARIARIRSLGNELRLPYMVAATLAHKERELGGSTFYNDVLESRIERLLSTERYDTPWARTFVFDDFETREAWEKERRAFVMAKIGEGATTIEPHHWDRAYTNFRYVYEHGPTGIGTGAGKGRKPPRRTPPRRGR